MAIKNLYSKALRAYFSLRRHFNNNVFTNPKTQCILFNSCISPILQYGSEVWGAFITSKKPDANIFKQNMFKDTNIMEKLHIRFCKQILGIHSKSSNHACRAELGRLHFAYNIYCNVIKYWNRLCSINEDCLVNEALYLSFKIASKGKVTWISSVKYILQLINESMIISKIYNMHTIKKKLKDLFLDQFFKKLNNNSKLEIYNTVKRNYIFENYLSEIKNPNHRVAVTKLRTSTHKFPIETGRHKNIPRSQRKCTISDADEIGYEFHYLMKCTNQTFTNLRVNFLEHFIRTKQSTSILELRMLI